MEGVLLHGTQTLIPFAGLLLEYPVSYVPISNQQTAFLPGISLDVYEMVIRCDSSCLSPRLENIRARYATGANSSSYQHTFLKFSCPCLIGSDPHHAALSPSNLRDRLFAQFSRRLAEMIGMPVPEGAEYVSIRHKVELLDRVAL
jgi:hypothetical protein